MQTAQAESWPEQQMVHRLFTIRWTRGFMITRIHGAKDDEMTRWQLDTWARVLDEVLPQLGPSYVSINDTRSIGTIPRALWLAIAQLTAGLARQPERRALFAADGWAGDNQAEAAQLVTAGNVRVFREDQVESMITWLAQPGTIDPYRLRGFLD